MLSFFDADARRSRRAFLTAGSLGFGGLSLANLLAARDAAAASGKAPITSGKSVIFLLQHGGPSQHETFDPKLDVPDGIRTVGGAVQTAVPGTLFGSTMAKLSALADKLAVVRSYATGSSAHSLRPLVDETTAQTNLGTLYSRLAGRNHPETGMPTNVALFPSSVESGDLGLGPEERFGKFNQTGPHPAADAPFVPGAGGAFQANLSLSLPSDRFDDRRALLRALDAVRADVDRRSAGESLDKSRQQAFEMVAKGVAKAFDLSEEDPALVAKYDTSRWVHETRYADKTNGNKSRRWYQANAKTLGKELLLARRLCEAGCGFVTVATRFVWDMHADQNNLDVTRGMEAVGQPFDHAVATFVEDCEARGLGDDILLVATGEMGRTPRVNKNGGRDHWGKLTPVLLYGGGVTRGQTIGQSARDGAEPHTDPQNTENLVATLMHALFDVGELRLARGLPTDLLRSATTGTPFPGLF